MSQLNPTTAHSLSLSTFLIQQSIAVLGLGRLWSCRVVDCGTSTISDDYYVLEDGNGWKKQVTADELHKICVN